MANPDHLFEALAVENALAAQKNENTKVKSIETMEKLLCSQTDEILFQARKISAIEKSLTMQTDIMLSIATIMAQIEGHLGPRRLPGPPETDSRGTPGYNRPPHPYPDANAHKFH